MFPQYIMACKYMHELTHASRKVFLKFMLSIENTKVQCFQRSCSPSKIQKCSISKGHAIHRKYKSAVFLKVMLSIENTKVQYFQRSCSPSKIQKCSISKGHAIHRKYKSAVFPRVMLSIENTKVQCF